MNGNSRTILTELGSKICINETGRLDGIPVLVQSGTPGSRLLNRRWIEDAQAKGIRLISYDRPGYGGSSPRPGRTVADAAVDVAAIAKELNLDRLSVWGISGGGPHALACAALLPDLVVAAAVLASPAPFMAEGLDWFAGMGEENVAEFNAALDGRDTLTQFVEASAPNILSANPTALFQAWQSLISPVDAAILTEDIVIASLNNVREGISKRRDGWIDDSIAFTLPWGFELNQIRIPVLLMHGKQDRFSPFSHGEWLSKHIPNVDAHLLADDGHITLAVRKVPMVHSWLLSKMRQ
jgi:pimeloyl-ACP methyl ester carboxylesterase